MSIRLLITSATLFTMFFSSPAIAEDWAISAYGTCTTELGSTISSSGGLRASGGTAVLKCPLIREVGSSTLNNVYARMQRANTVGAAPFCTLNTTSNYGTPTSSSYGFASNTINYQSVSIPMPTQYYAGYADVLCLLNSGDVLFGIRYRQDN